MPASPLAIVIALLTPVICVLAFVQFVRAYQRFLQVVPENEFQRYEGSLLRRCFRFPFFWWPNTRYIKQDPKLRGIFQHLVILVVLLAVFTPIANRTFESLFNSDKKSLVTQSHTPDETPSQKPAKHSSFEGIAAPIAMLFIPFLTWLIFMALVIQRERIRSRLSKHHVSIAREHWFYFRMGYPFYFEQKTYAPTLLKDPVFCRLHETIHFLTRVLRIALLLLFIYLSVLIVASIIMDHQISGS